ncbi:hypothetical protein [Streptomyces fructofermentans]|uniref:Lipoprotein n=1 Tax=Streptomyces fructofermentans TaxID=152141 RepID=A0A918U2R0_9ACTN|nr:hypothetical protein [Streptomyces fructofermentans]GGX82699.1 hypothetical protein GCM10010515_57830 [Streptomyces fructofermentans]
MRARTTTITATLLGLAALTAGCGGSDNTSDAAANAAAERSTSPETAPRSGSADPRDFGEVLTFTDPVEGGTLELTVLEYEQGVGARTTADNEFGTAGYIWAALEIKACAKEGPAEVTRFPWTLSYADGARIEPSSVTYDDFPKPEYPYEATLKTGDCVRGKTVFAVPGTQRPERVLYSPESLPEPAEWVVPEA